MSSPAPAWGKPRPVKSQHLPRVAGSARCRPDFSTLVLTSTTTNICFTVIPGGSASTSYFWGGFFLRAEYEFQRCRGDRRFQDQQRTRRPRLQILSRAACPRDRMLTNPSAVRLSLKRTSADHEDLRRHQFGQLPEGEMGLRSARRCPIAGSRSTSSSGKPHPAIPETQQRRTGAGGRIRRRPYAGAIQRHHSLSRPRQRSHSR